MEHISPNLAEFIAKKSPKKKSALLDKYRHEILFLKKKGYGIDDILEFLEEYCELKVSYKTLQVYIKSINESKPLAAAEVIDTPEEDHSVEIPQTQVTAESSFAERFAAERSAATAHKTQDSGENTPDWKAKSLSEKIAGGA